MMTQHQTYTAFVRGAVVAAGRPAEVIATISAQGGDARRALIFSDRTGDQARLSGSGEIEATAPSEEAQGAVTLQVRVLPRHARWLEAQSGGPSASVRRLAGRWETSEEAEIRRYLARSGGRITDSMERELMDRALHAPWGSHG